MVFDYKLIPARKSQSIDSPQEIKGFSQRRQVVTRKLKRDRRRAKQDRRRCVRDGVIVSLSFKNNRRKLRDRRKKSGERRTPGRGRVFVL